jgi:glycine/D-amino acid oxidase-like deaminating enzyme
MFREKILGHQGLFQWVNQISRVSGIQIPFFRGALFEPFFTKTEFAHLHERIFHGNFHGLYKNKILTPQEFEHSYLGWSDLKKPALGAFQFFDDLWFDPGKCLDALEGALIKKGGNIIPGSFKALISENKEGPISIKVTIHSGSQEIILSCDQVVIACGASTNDILQTLEVPTLPLNLCTGVTTLSRDVNLRRQSPWCLRIRKTNIVGLESSSRYGSSSFNKKASSLSQLASQDKIHDIDETDKANNTDIFKLINRPQNVSYLWGARVRTKDRAPVMGNLKMLCDHRLFTSANNYPPSLLDSVWIITGFYKNGLQLSWSFAQKLSAAMLAKRPDFIEDDFSLIRILR